MDKIKEGKGTAQRNTVQDGMSSFNKNFNLYALRLQLKKHPIQDPVRIYVEGCKKPKLLRQVVLRSPPACLRGMVGGFIFTNRWPVRQRYEVFLRVALCA